MEREHRLEIFTRCLPLELEKTQEREGGRMVGALGVEDTRRTIPTKINSAGLKEDGVASTGPAWVCIRSFVYMLWLFAWYSNSGNEGISDSFFCSWHPFPPTELPLSALKWGLCLVLYLVTLCLTDNPGRTGLFWMKMEWIGGSREVERGDGEEWREENLWSNALYERRINEKYSFHLIKLYIHKEE